MPVNALFNAACMAQLAGALGLKVRVDRGGDAKQFHVSAVTGTRVAQDIWGLNQFSFLAGFIDIEEAQKCAWLGLVELAASAGYIDLAAWDQRGALTSAAQWFLQNVTEADDDPGRVCAQRLVERLDAPLGAAVNWDQAAFDAFESYLSLTRWIYADEPLVETLRVLHGSWRSGPNQVELLTPRALADALATGRVGAIEVRGAAGMPRLLDACEWLMEIADRVSHRTDLRDEMLRHARWSHAVWVARQRADEWARSMSEWAPARDRDGEARWSDFRQRVFQRLEAEQDRLGLSGTTNPRVKKDEIMPLAVSWTSDADEGQIDLWVAVGLDERARRAIVSDLDRASEEIDAGTTDSEKAAERLVERAERLAELGDLDSAAAAIAPHVAFIYEKLDSRHRQSASEICARARRGAKPSASAGTNAGQVELIEAPLELRAEPAPPAYRAIGESS
jgi:hypothetical protein